MEDSWEMVDKGESSTENAASTNDEDKEKPDVQVVIDQSQDDIDDIVMVDSKEEERLLLAKEQKETITPVPEDHHEQVTPVVEGHLSSVAIASQDEHTVTPVPPPPPLPVKDANPKQTALGQNFRKLRKSEPEKEDKKDRLKSTPPSIEASPKQVHHEKITPRHAIGLQTNIEYDIDTDEEEDLLSPRSFADVQRMLAGYRDTEVRNVKIYTPEELDQMMREEQESGDGKEDEQEVEAVENRNKVETDTKRQEGKKDDRLQTKDIAGKKKDKEAAGDDVHMKSSDVKPKVAKLSDDKEKSSEEGKPTAKVTQVVSPDHTTDGQEHLSESVRTEINAKKSKEQKHVEVEELFEGDTSSNDSGKEGGDYSLDYTLEDIEEAMDDQVGYVNI